MDTPEGMLLRNQGPMVVRADKAERAHRKHEQLLDGNREVDRLGIILRLHWTLAWLT
jgi:hypothetical protein